MDEGTVEWYSERVKRAQVNLTWCNSLIHVRGISGCGRLTTENCQLRAQRTADRSFAALLIDMDRRCSCRSQFSAAKISRVRWLDLSGKQRKFITATYDHRNSAIAAWSMPQDSEQVDDIFDCECELSVTSEVNDLLFYDATKFVAAMNDGAVRLFEYDENVIKPRKKFINMHSGCSCNALCHDNGNIISGGEGGTLASLSLDDSSTKIISSGMASIRSLVSIGHQVFVSAHLDGQICLWDRREGANSSSKPSFSSRVTECFQGVTALAAHPAEPNLIGFGTENGGIGFLDTRRSSYMLNSVSVPFPVGAVWEVAFHPIYPSNFYCATGKGHLLHLSVRSSALSNPVTNFNSQSRANAWLSPSVRSGNANVSVLIDGLISVNTFNVATHGILVCSDNQMITFIDEDYLA